MDPPSKLLALALVVLVGSAAARQLHDETSFDTLFGYHEYGLGVSQLTPNVSVSVDLSRRKPAAPLLYGIFFEEINHGGEGGLYGELVRDRSFDAAAWVHLAETQNRPLLQDVADASVLPPRLRRYGAGLSLQSSPAEGKAWRLLPGTNATLSSAAPIHSKNPNFLRVTVSPDVPSGGIYNLGYWGIGITAGTTYQLTLFVRVVKGAATGLTASLTSPSGSLVRASAALQVPTTEGAWTKLHATLRPTASDPEAVLVLQWAAEPGGGAPVTVDVDVVSLFALGADGQAQLFRQDLLGMLKELKPTFVRFPGGCYVEGQTLDTAFYWKNNTGPIEERSGHWNSVWGYWSTDGLGLYEYLVLAEQLGAEPVWVVNVGISHQQQVGPQGLRPFLDDALDSLEFIRGPATSKWGKLRASMGRREPFSLKFMAIGNENCGYEHYAENYNIFYDVIKALYPDITLIANCHMHDDGPTELYDYHRYESSDSMWSLRHLFDGREFHDGVDVFASEYAVTNSQEGSIIAAVAEAGYMLGMERNPEAVKLASYAPLFVNANNRAWTPNLIAFDSSRAYGIPSYYAQSLFRRYQGTHALLTTVAPPSAAHWVDALGSCLDDACASVAVKIVNYDIQSKRVTLTLQGDATTMSDLLPLRTVTAKHILLHSRAPFDSNTFDAPAKVVPRTLAVSVTLGEPITVLLPPFSINFLVVPLKAPRHGTGADARTDAADGNAATTTAS